MLHLVAEGRRKTNPLLDSRGGKRIFHKGLKEAVSKIQGSLKESREAAASELRELLAGERQKIEGGQFNAGSWFPSANKIYNHSPSDCYNEGKVSPWEMACACEGFEFLVAALRRRLSLRSHPMAGVPVRGRVTGSIQREFVWKVSRRVLGSCMEPSPEHRRTSRAVRARTCGFEWKGSHHRRRRLWCHS